MNFSFDTQIFPVCFNTFEVPGAEMVVAQGTDWRKLYPPVSDQMSRWALRSLVVAKSGSIVLIDTGFGNKQSENFFHGFKLEGEFDIESQLQEIGLSRKDITDVVLTHLHYDHAGGCLLKHGNVIQPAYPNAKLWISSVQWENAMNPCEKEQESYLKENMDSLNGNYAIQLVGEGSYLPGIQFKMFHGHTPGQLVPLIKSQKGLLLFGADLFPSSVHIHPEVNMTYDVDPKMAELEKKSMLEACIHNNYVVVFQHGLYIEAGTISFRNNQYVVSPVKLEEWLS